MRSLVIGLVLVFVAAEVDLPSTQTIYDDGLWPLAVSIHVAGERPIKRVSAEALPSVSEASKRLAVLPPLAFTRFENSRYAVVQEPRTDEPLEIKIPTDQTIRGTGPWTRRSYSQYRGLLVVVEYADGQLVGRAVEIPDLRSLEGPRRLDVEVP